MIIFVNKGIIESDCVCNLEVWNERIVLECFKLIF